MYEKYTLAIIRFPLVNTSDTKYNITFFHRPGKQEQLQVDIYFKISSVNGIHTEEVDLLEFKQLNDLHSWYPIFGIPYTIPTNIDYTPHTAVIKIVHIDKPEDLNIFSPMFEFTQQEQLFTNSYYNYNKDNINSYWLRLDKQEASRILSISHILIELHVLKVHLNLNF